MLLRVVVGPSLAGEPLPALHSEIARAICDNYLLEPS
jgi:hypothetical protein